MKHNSLLLLVLALLCVSCSETPKIAFVKSAYLVENYSGMKEARNIFQEKEARLSVKLDSLQKVFQESEAAFIAGINTMTAEQRKESQLRLEMIKREFQAQAMEIEEQLSGMDEEMSKGVLNQINSFVEQYGKDQGYQFILGTTAAGSILYGDQAADITEEVLEALNEQYVSP